MAKGRDRLARAAGLGLVVVLLLAFGLRFAGVARLLQGYRPGEGTEGEFLNRVIDLYLQFPNLDPKVFDWPPLFQYLVLFAFKAYGFVWTHLLALGDADAFIFQNQADKTWLYFIARMGSVSFGTATAAATYGISKRFYGPVAALAGALFVALAPMHVEFCQLAQIDATMVFLSTAALGLCLLIYERGRMIDYVLAGIAIGLGTAAKYLPILILLSAFAAHRLPRARRSWRPLLLCAGVAILTFFIASPYSFLRMSSLLDIRHQFTHGSDPRLAGKAGVIASFFLRGLSLPLSILGFAGLRLAFKRKPKELLILGSFPACVVVFFLCWVPHDYYLLPLVPVMGIFSCEAIESLGGLLRDRRLTAAALAASFAWPLAAIVSYDRKVMRTTTLEEMKGWIDANVPAGAPIVSFVNSSNLLLSEFVKKPGTPLVFLYSRYDHKYLRNDAVYDLGQLRRNGERYIVVSDDDTTASSAHLIDQVRAQCRLLKEVDDDPDRLGPTVKLFRL